MIEYPYLHESGKIPASLAGVPFLASVSSDCIDKVLSHTSIVECAPGDVILEEGESGQGIFFLLIRGSATVTRKGEEVGQVDSAGELIGEKAILEESGGTRNATITAKEHSFFIKVDAHYLEELSDAERQSYDAALFRFLAGVMAERLSQANERIAELEQRLG